MKSQRIAPFTVLIISVAVLASCSGRANPENGPVPAAARDTTLVAAQAAPPAMPGTPHYDVVLEVPGLSVGSIDLNVAGLLARVALDANAANLVAISAGAVVGTDRVKLGLYGVQTEAYLYADLDNVGHIMRRVVKTLDKNPHILARLRETADSLVNEVGNVANTALEPGGVVSQTVGAAGRTLQSVTPMVTGLLSQVTNTVGQLVQHVVTQNGSILERTLDATGKVLDTRTLGSVLELPLVRQGTNDAGQPIRVVRDPIGNLIEATLAPAGGVIGCRVIQRVGP